MPSRRHPTLVPHFARRLAKALGIPFRAALRSTRDVEQLYCTSEAGGAITFADLTQPAPQLFEVSLEEVQKLNSTVRAIIR